MRCRERGPERFRPPLIEIFLLIENSETAVDLRWVAAVVDSVLEPRVHYYPVTNLEPKEE
jgi:hypothetical protein